MAAEEEVVILARLAGTRQFLVDAGEIGAAIKELGIETETTGTAMTRTSRRGFFMNQALFTMRRLMYGVSLATIAAGVAAVKWGWDFNSTMQQARIALQPVAHDIGGVQNRLTDLYNFTKYTPFQFKDVTVAFRQMYLGMRLVGVTADDVQSTLHAVVDALSATGRTSPGALNRVAVALQHMAYQGHLTGQTVNQLARDGLPIFAALRKELGLSADQMHNVGQLGIPTLTVLQALNHYIETTPGLANAAYRQATGSLHGLFTTFRDNLSQLMGSIEKGFFGRLQDDLVRMNAWFDRLGNAVQTGNMNNVITAINPALLPMWRQLAAAAHDFWVIVRGLIGDLARSGVVWGALFAALVLVRGVLGFIVPQTHALALLLEILIPLWISYKTAIILLTAAEKANVFWTAVMEAKTKDLTFAQALMRLWVNRVTIAETLQTRATKLLIAAQILLTDTLEAARVAAATFAVTLDLALGPIGWIALGITLVVAALTILFFKWNWFHNLVMNTFHWIESHWRLLGAVILAPFVGPLLIAGLAFKRFKSDVAGVIGWVWDKMRWLESGLTRLWKHIPGHGLIGSVLGHIPGLASGGSVQRPGLTMVGERGPELLTLPAGATVRPLQAPSYGLLDDYLSAPGERQPIIIQLMMPDKRVLAEAYAEVQMDKAARA